MLRNTNLIKESSQVFVFCLKNEIFCCLKQTFCTEMASINKFDNRACDYVVSIDFHERHICDIIGSTRNILRVDHKIKIQKCVK